MLILFIIMTTIFILLFSFLNLLFMINKHKKKDREKNSPFECGFDPFINPRISFSIHFFMIMIMFLIFDIEIAIIIPSILTTKLPLTSWISIMFFIILILLLGMILEWKEGCMNWK